MLSGQMDKQAHGSLVKWLRRCPLTAESGVRLPYELLTVYTAQPVDRMNFYSCGFFFIKMKKGGDILSLRETYELKTEEFLLPILEELSFELIDIEYVKEGSDYFLRIYIDKPGGITIEDCVDVSRKMNDILDTEDYIKDPYTFEVSSPGLGRTLKKDKDLNRSLGMDVNVKTYKAMDGAKEFTGILKEYDDTTITLEYDDEEIQVFSRKDIALIRLSIDF